MRQVILTRFLSCDQGTFGVLKVQGDEQNFRTLELPWRENKRMVSCIPKGKYICKSYKSKKYSDAYIVTNVNGRSYILFHSGNFAGDVNKGFLTHSNGCILLGQKMGYLGKQLAILNSKVTVNKFLKFMKKEEFELDIRELW